MRYGRTVYASLILFGSLAVCTMAVAPYESHEAADTAIDAAIRDVDSLSGVTRAGVSDTISKTAAMVDAIVRTTAAGATTYHAPVTRTPEAWFALLKELLETGGDNEPTAGDTFVLPPVVMIPSDNATITVATANITVRGNGARIVRGGSSPGDFYDDLIVAVGTGGVWSGLEFGAAASSISVERLAADGSSVLRIAGEATEARDTLLFEDAIETLTGLGGGTLP